MRGVGVAGSGYLVSQALVLTSYLVLARIADPADFGRFAAASIVVGVGALFAESGMLAALVRRADRVEEAASTAFVATLVGGLLLAGLAAASAPLLGWIFGSDLIAAVAAALSGVVALRSATVVPDALMQRRFSFARRLVVEPLSVTAFGVTAVLACAQGLGVWGLVLGAYASAVTAVVLSFALARWRPRARLVSFALWREMAGFGRHVVASEAVRRVGDELDTILIGRFLGAPSLGQYRYASRVAMRPLSALVDGVSHVLYPAFARIADDRPRFRLAFVRTLGWVAVVAFPTSLILFPLGEPFLVLLLGERWQPAGQALAALCAYSAGHALVSLASEGLKAAGRPAVLTRIHALWVVLTAGLMLAFLPLGLVGVAVGASLSSLGVGAYALFAVARATGVGGGAMARALWAPAVAALVMAGAIASLERLVVHADDHATALGLVLLAGEAALGALVYLALLALLASGLRRELLGLGGGLWRRRRGAEARPAAARVAASR